MFRFMQLGISALLMALLASWVVAAPYDSTYVPRPTADFVIRNAVVYDGTGAEPKVSDVVVKGGRISAMGVDLNLEGLQIIDAKGHWLTPGIIDVHSHLGVYPSPSIASTSDGNEATAPSTAQV